ncbi:MAG: ABC transporter substrate-binding protein, partial [Planctomycetes bacterium]|nr:ABC transporter substrate-binding protein [Planctomycetota bacterium]
MRSFVMCAVAVAMALLLPACGGGTSADSSAAGAATFVFARGADSKRLDPISVSDGESVKVIEQVFDTLIRFDDASADLKPALATEWKPAAGDAKTWEFTLRQGVKFHD